jgi:DHA2 family multidrug resistance protein
MPVARLTGIQRFDLRWLIGGGLAVAGIGLLWLAGSVTTQSDLGTLVPPLLVIGTGSACVYSPLLVAVMRAVAPDAAPKAASFIVLAFQLGGSISSAGIVAFVDRREQFHQTILAAEATLSRLPVVQFLQHATAQQLAAAVTSQAVVLAYDDAFFITGVLALLVTPSVLLLGRKRT